MKRIGFLIALFGFSSWAFAAPDTTVSILPVAASGATITAADENARNATISTAYNAHSHIDITQVGNTLSVGTGVAGNKSICGNAADAIDSCLRWNDTSNLWQADQPTAGNYNQIIVSAGTTALTSNALIIGGGTSVISASAITLGSTLPTTFGDYSARAFNSAAISLVSGTITILTLDSERWDTDTIHNTGVNTSRLTATTAGKYQIEGHAEFATGGSGQRRLDILLNGATVIAGQDCAATTSPVNSTIQCSIATHYNLAATDYVELRGLQRVSAPLNVNAASNYSPEFEMVKVP